MRESPVLNYVYHILHSWVRTVSQHLFCFGNTVCAYIYCLLFICFSVPVPFLYVEMYVFQVPCWYYLHKNNVIKCTHFISNLNLYVLRKSKAYDKHLYTALVEEYSNLKDYDVEHQEHNEEGEQCTPKSSLVANIWGNFFAFCHTKRNIIFFFIFNVIKPGKEITSARICFKIL